ncbi:B12-binding domain-containing radical SAM protein [Chloroflexota bacterium]
MKRILLIAPPFYRLLGSHYNGLHLGIAYIAAVLKENGHYVKIYNADYYNDIEYLNQRQLFKNSPSYKTILDDLTDPIWVDIRDNISSFKPDLIGITMLTANYRAAKNIGKIAKDIDSKIKIVVGGAHPTLDPEGTFTEEFDYVVRGEGELTFLELADGCPEEEIKGLSFKKNGRIIHNESRLFIDNLDSLPFPCRDSFLNDADTLNVGYITTGRGCTFACSYCASPRLWQRKVRFRSVMNIINELEYIKKTSNPPVIHFVDDAFTLNMPRAKEICRQIINKQLNINWIADTRVDCLDEELVSLMKEAGCTRMKIGVESGSDRILEVIKKGINREKIRKGVEIIKTQGLPLTVYLMAGFPGETDADLEQTIEFAKELEVDYYSLSICTPYYGTQIWSELEKSGNKIDKAHWEYFYHQNLEMIVNKDLSQGMINKFLALNEQGKGERL